MSEAPPPSEPQSQAPHPVLPEYYERADQRRKFLREIFDRTASDYDATERLFSFGTGSGYRRMALRRAGLDTGMHVLDVAVGTGLVAREALHVVGARGLVVGVDPSWGMLSSAPQVASMPLVQGTSERLPFASARFDFLSLGFALRHLSELDAVFGEFRRVLKPGGIVCLLEITPPERLWVRRLLKLYLRHIAPVASRLVARQPETPRLLRYFWDTIEACVPPQGVLEALHHAGFTEVRRHVEAHLFSEYTARR